MQCNKVRWQECSKRQFETWLHSLEFYFTHSSVSQEVWGSAGLLVASCLSVELSQWRLITGHNRVHWIRARWCRLMVMQLFLSVSQVINFSPKTIAVFIGVVGILSILAQVFNWGNILDSALLLVSLSRRGVSWKWLSQTLSNWIEFL